MKSLSVTIQIANIFANLDQVVKPLSCLWFSLFKLLMSLRSRYKYLFLFSIERPWMWDVKYDTPDCHSRIWSPS